MENVNESAKPMLHELKLKTWESLLQDKQTSVDLTSKLDWPRCLRSFTKLAACNMAQLEKVCGEIHSTAICPWTEQPAFHFVLYGFDKFHVRLSLARSGTYTLMFERDGEIISIDQAPPESGEASLPRPRERDICEAFGSRCLEGRQLKAFASAGSRQRFKDLVKEFVRDRAALRHRGGIHRDDAGLQEAAQQLVYFDSRHLRWKLVKDEDELGWRKFLFDRTLEPAKLFNYLSGDRLKECVLHVPE